MAETRRIYMRLYISIGHEVNLEEKKTGFGNATRLDMNGSSVGFNRERERKAATISLVVDKSEVYIV